MKKRIIPALLLNGGSSNVCLSQSFAPWRTIGTLAQQLRLHVGRHCDELLVINLNEAVSNMFELPPRLIKLVSDNVDIPVAYAGGIIGASDASSCINQCFDKVFITTAFLDDPKSLQAIASVVGQQSVGVCLPYRYDSQSGNRYVWDFRNSTCLREYSIDHYISLAVDYGAGEILLYSVDRDGQLCGLDVEIVESLSSLRIAKPILLGGGAGSPEHFSEALHHDLIQGVVAGSIFALTKETPQTIRDFCISKGILMRRV